MQRQYIPIAVSPEIWSQFRALTTKHGRTTTETVSSLVAVAVFRGSLPEVAAGVIRLPRTTEAAAETITPKSQRRRR